MKFPVRALALASLALGLAVLVSGCAGQHVSSEPVAKSPQAVVVDAPAPQQAAKAAKPAEPAKPLAAAKARETELSDQDMDRIRQSLGKDAFDQTGVAGWADLPGQGTGGLTAAHPSLPVGSKVEVTNLDNSRRIVVMITDRGKFSDRAIDLSRHAAEKLGLMDTGQAQVGLRVLDRPRGKTGRTAKASIKKVPAKTAQAAPRAPAPAPAGEDEPVQAPAKTQAKGRYYVQVGSFASKANAEALVKRLSAQGYKGSRLLPTSQGGKTLYRVQAGAFTDKAQASGAQGALKGEFPSSYVLTD